MTSPGRENFHSLLDQEVAPATNAARHREDGLPRRMLTTPDLRYQTPRAEKSHAATGRKRGTQMGKGERLRILGYCSLPDSECVVDHLLRLAYDRMQMGLALETFCVNLVDVFCPRGTSCKPAALG